MSNDMDMTIGGESGFSLAELAGLDMSEVTEVRTTILPVAVYHWIVDDYDFGKVEYKDGKTGEDKEALKLTLKCKVLEVNEKSITGKAVDVEELVGKISNVEFFISPEDPAKGLGRFKAFCVDTGFAANGSPTDILEAMKGNHEFWGKIKHRPNKNDKDSPFANISMMAKDLKPA